jgi:hypothetical protein
VRPALRILTADDRGVPTTAECPCGWSWARPHDDEWADTLTVEALLHPCSAEAEP